MKTFKTGDGMSLIEAIVSAVILYESQGIMSNGERENVSVYMPRYMRQHLLEELHNKTQYTIFDPHKDGMTKDDIRIRGYKVVDGYEDKIVVAHREDIFYNPDRIVKAKLEVVLKSEIKGSELIEPANG
jgi:hypothetical protein